MQEQTFRILAQHMNSNRRISRYVVAIDFWDAEAMAYDLLNAPGCGDYYLVSVDPI